MLTADDRVVEKSLLHGIEKAAGGNFKSGRDFLQNTYGGVSNAAFNPADVGAVEVGFEGKLFL
jgi:hypothetical protein